MLVCDSFESLLLSLFPCSVWSGKGFANLSLHTFELSVSAFEIVKNNLQRTRESPFPSRVLTNVFVSSGDFWGQHETPLYPRQIHAGIVLSHRVSLRFCTDLQQFGCIIWRFFFLSHIYWAYCIHLCLAVTGSAGWNISPALNSFICGCCGLAVIFFSQNVFSFCHAPPPPPSGRWPWPRWVIS